MLFVLLDCQTDVLQFCAFAVQDCAVTYRVIVMTLWKHDHDVREQLLIVHEISIRLQQCQRLLANAQGYQ